MTIYVVEPNKKGYAKEIDNSLKAMQEVVDGLIEVVNLTEHTKLICNEEGKLKGLAPNIKIHNDIICGTCFFVGADGEDFTDIDSDTLKYLEMYQYSLIHKVRKKYA